MRAAFADVRILVMAPLFPGDDEVAQRGAARGRRVDARASRGAAGASEGRHRHGPLRDDARRSAFLPPRAGRGADEPSGHRRRGRGLRPPAGRRVRRARGRVRGRTGPLANSAATLRLPAARFDAVRCGVALYGLSPFGDDPAAHGLEPVLSWTSYVVQAKTLATGESTGYGRRFVAERADADRARPRRLRGRLPARPHRHRGAGRRLAAPRARDGVHGLVRRRARRPGRRARRWR